MRILIEEHCGSFAENKDQARNIRENHIRPVLDSTNDIIVLDFFGVDSSTQSFIHALISGFFQELGEKALERFEFHNCSKAVKSLVATVINYSLE
ncbi:MAG: STAS-like domain-containing protein [Sedimentisphaerales bacterium]|nr:STAS-like domain-containing protein [Sedimentisphaerales bacterium]